MRTLPFRSQSRIHPNSSLLHGIYAIVDDAPDTPARVDEMLSAGIKLFQYRAKRGVDRASVRTLRTKTSRAGALLIVNDDLDAAMDADGLHVGPDDVDASSVKTLRAQLGTRILGVSCGVPDEVPWARALGADYLGTGPFAHTPSKADAGPPIGARGLAAVVAAAGALPVAAIGGIGLDDLEAVIGAGARMAAIISALRAPCARATEFVARWDALAP